MLKFRYSPQQTVFKTNLKKLLSGFSGHQLKVAEFPFSQLPWENFTGLIKEYSAKKYDRVFVVGIGGSSLGVKALAEALGNKRLRYLDNIDSDFVYDNLKGINAKKSLFLLISKSGETIEILSLAKMLLLKFPKQNFIAVTDDFSTPLGKLATAKKIPIIKSHKNVPGRFSVLSVSGLLPAHLAGLNINKVLKGAKETSHSAAFSLACHQYLHFSAGKNIAVFFPYSERLSNFADWYIQLLSESAGKTKKIGITPIKAIGVKDQHSQLQLFLDGPDDKFFILLKPDESHQDFKVPGESYTLNELFEAEYIGVKKALQERNKPFVEISFPKISPEILGELFFLFELQMAYLGSLFKINIENQPAVELSKKLTRKALKVCNL